MKRIATRTVVTIFVSWILLGCGSNSKPDPVKGSDSPYVFINVSTPVDINESDADFELFVQLLKNGFGAEGALVRIAPFDVHYGYVRPSSVETDEDGWAIYTYHSPEDVDKLAGQSKMLSIVYDDGNGTVIFESIVLDFVVPKPQSPDETPCNDDGNRTCS